MTLRECFEQHGGRVVGKVDDFFDAYEQHLSPYRGLPVRILEIGVDRGGSLELWRNYFGAEAEIHGIDINPDVLDCAPDDAFVHIGSQSDSDFLEEVSDKYGPFDIVIDDGSHVVDDQILTFEVLYPRLKSRAVYICEDCFTSYWPEYGGKCGSENTFIEYAKRLVDELHAYWQFADGREPTDFTRSTRAIHFYSGTAVFERKPAQLPTCSVRAKGGSHEISIEALKVAAADNLPVPGS